MESLSRQLARVDLFAELPDDVRDEMVQAGTIFTHRPGSVVVEQGAEDRGFRLVLEGKAAVEVNGEYRATLGPGDFFGELALLDGHPRSATVRAGDEGLRTFALSSLAFSPLLDGYPQVSRSLLKALCARIRALDAAPPKDH